MLLILNICFRVSLLYITIDFLSKKTIKDILSSLLNFFGIKLNITLDVFLIMTYVVFCSGFTLLFFETNKSSSLFIGLTLGSATSYIVNKYIFNRLIDLQENISANPENIIGTVAEVVKKIPKNKTGEIVYSIEDDIFISPARCKYSTLYIGQFVIISEIKEDGYYVVKID